MMKSLVFNEEKLCKRGRVNPVSGKQGRSLQQGVIGALMTRCIDKVVLQQEGPLPASFDGHIAFHRLSTSFGELLKKLKKNGSHY